MKYIYKSVNPEFPKGIDTPEYAWLKPLKDDINQNGLSKDRIIAILSEPQASVHWNKKTSSPENSSRYVIALQAALTLLKHSNKGKIDGLYGPKTKAQVKAFQTAEGLQVDGAPGPETIGRVLERLNAITPPTAPADSTATKVDTAANTIPKVPLNITIKNDEAALRMITIGATDAFIDIQYYANNQLDDSYMWPLIKADGTTGYAEIKGTIELTTTYGTPETYAVDSDGNMYLAQENIGTNIKYGYKYSSDYKVENNKVVKRDGYK